MSKAPAQWPGFKHLLIVLTAGSLAHSASSAAAPLAEHVRGKNIAALAFAQNDLANPFLRRAQSRLEDILVDNNITVLDPKRADELKNVFKGLEDPGVFVTAETFVENVAKYDLSGLMVIYVSADVVPGLADYFSATAHAEVRFIDNQNARVTALTTPAMGTAGRPPSDGLTRQSAAINAIQRAVDSACDLVGLEITDRIRARAVRIKLAAAVAPADLARPVRRPENDKSLWPLAVLENEKWRRETITCTARSTGGDLAALGGYIRDTQARAGRSGRLYGSRVHVADTKTGESLNTFECSPVERKTREERNTKQVLDCLFISNWRYLAAATGNHLLFWNTERGELLSKLPLRSKSATLGFERDPDGRAWLVVDQGRNMALYQIVRDR